MKALLLTICLLALAFTAHAADVTLTWDANTETDLAGYRVYQGNGGDLGTFTRVQDIVAPTTSVTVKGLDSSAHSFAVTAYNTAGVESAYSNIATIPAAPLAPAGLKWSLTMTLVGQ